MPGLELGIYMYGNVHTQDFKNESKLFKIWDKTRNYKTKNIKSESDFTSIPDGYHL